MLSKEQASRLWNDLRGNLLATQATIKKIIEERAWEPLGYASFTHAWEERMRGIELSAAIRSDVIYAMFAEGATVEEARKAMALQDTKAAGFKVAYDKGVPAESAETLANSLAKEENKKALEALSSRGDGYSIVEEHYRKHPGPKSKVHIVVGRENLQAWRAYAKKKDLCFDHWISNVLMDAMDEVMKSDN